MSYPSLTAFTHEVIVDAADNVNVTDDGAEGGAPDARLVSDAAGDLFGTTSDGGAFGYGTAFEIPMTPDGYGAITTLASVSDATGSSLVPDAAGAFFGTTYLGGDHNGGMIHEVTDTGYVACSGRGTLITTETGDRPVEDLGIGDRLVTASGAIRPIKWIGTRSYAGRFANGNRDVLPIRFKAGSLCDNVPRRDLRVSPRHAMVLDGVLIPAEHLVNGVSIVQADSVERIDDVRIELDSHDVIIAEGALSETFFDDDSRPMFHDARGFWVLYPTAQPRPAHYCAPRVETGFVLELVRRRLDERAGLVDGSPGAGPFCGTLDRADHEGVEGWAQNLGHPGGPVCLKVLIDGFWRARTLAQHYRDDLRAAGIGSGSHGFRLRLEPPLSADTDHVIEVRRSFDGAALWCAPRCIAASRAAA